MGEISKISKLASLCKCSLEIMVNQNRNYYESIEEYFASRSDDGTIEGFLEFERINKDIYNKIIKLNNLIEIRAYSSTPVGFFHVYHYNMDLAIDEMMEIIEGN